MKRIQLNISPAVLAFLACAVLIPAIPATVFVLMITNESLFRGNYLAPLLIAGCGSVAAAFAAWVIYSVAAAGDLSLSPPNPELVRAVGAEQASQLVRAVGAKQAEILGRLATQTGRWGLTVLLKPVGVSVGLWGKGVTDADLADLAAVQALTWLNLSDCPVTDTGLVTLTHLTHLGGLILSGTKITDAGLTHLLAFPRLATLDVDGTAVTDAGLRAAGLIEKKVSLKQTEQQQKAAGTLGFPPPPVDLQKPLSRMSALYQQKEFAKAETYARKALAIAEAAGPPEHAVASLWVARCLAFVGLLENAQGKWAEAEPRLQKALGLAEAGLGPMHRDLERILWNLGQGQRAQGKFADAESNLKRSLALAERYSLDTAEQHAELALVYAFQGRLEAGSHFNRAAELWEKSLAEGAKHAPNVRACYAYYLKAFAAAARQRGRAEVAEKLEAKAVKILAASRG